MPPSDERETIFKSMEEHNVELTIAFEKYNQIENIKVPEIDEGGEIDPKVKKLLIILAFPSVSII
jgi:hypothetical protein